MSKESGTLTFPTGEKNRQLDFSDAEHPKPSSEGPADVVGAQSNEPPVSESTLGLHLQVLMRAVGEDPTREGLQKTPERFLRAFRFLTSGYDKDLESVLNGAIFEVPYSEMVIVRDIEIYSLCEHHLLPFFGKCHVGYIPQGKILGLSKIPRIVEIYARRLQVQERLTTQISESIMQAINPAGVGVIIEAHHLCMMMRGVEKQNASAKTSALLGCFQKPSARAEFFNLIK